MIKRKILGANVIRWTVITGVVGLVLVITALALVQTFARSMGSDTRQTISLLVVGAVFCLVIGTTGLIFGLNRLWSASLRKNDGISQNRIITWIMVLAIGLPWLGSSFSGQFESILFGNMGARLGEQGGFLSKLTFPATFYLLQALVMALMVYALILKPGRLAPGFIQAYQGGVWPLLTGAFLGLAGWLVGIFLTRIMSAIIPQSWGALPIYLDHLSVGSLGRMNWTQILIMLGLAPLAEELFLRGYVLPGWIHKWGPGFGWVATAALSGLLALNPAAFPAIFLFSLSLCWFSGHVRHLAPVWTAHLVYISFYLLLMPN